MKKLTLYPYESWTLDFGITQLTFASVVPIWQLVQFFQRGEGAFLSEDGQEVNLKKVVYVGDVATRFDYGKLYAKALSKVVGQQLDDVSLRELYEADRLLRSHVNRVLFENDLPGEIDDDWDASELLKYLNLRVEMPEQRDFYGIIESVIDVSQRLNDQRLLVFVNASLYLNEHQLQALAYDAYMKQVSCLFIDRGHTANFISGVGLKQHFIDQDFVEFVSDDANNE
ncbi:MAG TPA: type II-A CRISPR-associated protein Csn2 [Lactobacillaceae bacterium]|jgi:CRISPR type II-A-associated protein Csn2